MLFWEMLNLEKKPLPGGETQGRQYQSGTAVTGMLE